jgi:outer membrane protein assembly factor BamB
MKRTWNLFAFLLFTAVLIGCDNSPPPSPPPKIDLGTSSGSDADATPPAGQNEPDTKKDSSGDATFPDAKPDDKPMPDEAKPDASDKPKADDAQANSKPRTEDKPKSDDKEVALAKPAAVAGGAWDPTAESLKVIKSMKVKPGDWPQFFGSSYRNNVPEGKGIATEWDVDTGENIKWASKLGSETYGNPVVANGKVYVGTNNASGYLKRYPYRIDLGCLICFDEESGEFLWQHSSEKLPTGRVHDWPHQGICSAPLIVGDRLWFVSSRGEVLCLDTEGFRDGENDGPFTSEKPDKPDTVWDEKFEADLIWKFDMMGQLGVSQHNMCSCSVTYAGDILFVNTSNGVDEGHINVPQAQAPSFVAMDMHTGEVLWTDNSPGENVLHGQWSSPSYAVLGGQPQVLFGAGDGWLYSFDPKGEDGKAKLLWKFDCNPKDSVYLLGGRATRNHLIATPVIHDGLVYIAVGEDPEHGEGVGHLWCIDPTKRGDVSPKLVFNVNVDEGKSPIPHKRLKACEANKGDFTRPNENSAAVWHYAGNDPQRNDPDNPPQRLGKFETTMHRTCGTVCIKNNLLFIADFSGLFHCVDQKTGKAHWTYDMLAASWASPLIVENHVYIGDEDGDISIFGLSADPNIAMKEIKNREGEAILKDGKPELFPLNGRLTEDGNNVEVTNMGSAVYTTPVVANDTLFIANRNQLFCIKPGTKSKVEKPLPVSVETD